MARWVANARMYAVSPAVALAWKDLFGWLAGASGVDLAAVDHAFPAPLSALWDRPDLACGFICGWPYLLRGRVMRPVAAPVPDRGPAAGTPRYATHFVVRADSPFATLEETFGHRIGYTAADSQSGFNAPRHHLLRWRRERGGPLYAETIGPLVTPRRVIEALLAGAIDVGPLDSYAFNLMRAHEPEVRALLRVVATTDPTPMPFLAAHPDCPDEIVGALRGALLRVGDDPACAGLRDDLCLAGFAAVNVAAYDVLTGRAAEAERADYGVPL